MLKYIIKHYDKAYIGKYTIGKIVLTTVGIEYELFIINIRKFVSKMVKFLLSEFFPKTWFNIFY